MVKEIDYSDFFLKNQNALNALAKKIDNTASNSVSMKELISTVKMVKEQTDEMEGMIKTHMGDFFHMRGEIAEDILSFSENKIKEMTEEEIMKYLKKYYILDDEYKKLEELISDNQFNSDPSYENLTRVGALRKILLDIKKESDSMYSLREEFKNIEKETTDILKDYNEYLYSPEMQKKKMEKLQKLKEEAEKTTDEKEKKEMLKKIEVMEASYSLSFLFSRINKYGEKEIDSIVNAFFDKSKGSYIIDKYKNKIKLFGFNNKVYKYFFNIEENFLDETYHPFNNLFLFIYMRMIAYFDPYNTEEKLYAQSLTSSLANLIYHRFEKTEKEKEFLEIIQKILDKFDSYREEFSENNTTNPNHPLRIKVEKEHESKRREFLMKKMDDMGITGYPEEGTANELQEYMNDAIDEMVKEKKTSGNVNVETDDDGIVHVSSNLHNEGDKND